MSTSQLTNVKMSLTDDDMQNVEEIRQGLGMRSPEKLRAVRSALSISAELVRRVNRGEKLYFKDKSGVLHHVDIEQ